MRAEDKNRKPGPDLLQFFNDTSFPKRKIEYYCIPFLLLDQPKSLKGGVCFAKNSFQWVMEDDFQTLPDDYVTVCDE